MTARLQTEAMWRMIGQGLTEKEMSALTEMVLERCEWFPSIAECKRIMGEQSYNNPFHVKRINADLQRRGYLAAVEECKRITDARD